MSEKRFKLWKTFDRDGYTDDWGVIDTFNNDIDYEEYVLDEDEVIDLLNQLSDENKQLKEDNEKWERFANMEFIKGSTEIGRLNKNIVDLKKENEQLRQSNKNCAINSDAKYPCKAYEECLARKGTNKPLPCMVNWIMGNTFDNMIKKEKDNE